MGCNSSKDAASPADSAADRADPVVASLRTQLQELKEVHARTLKQLKVAQATAQRALAESDEKDLQLQRLEAARAEEEKPPDYHRSNAHDPTAGCIVDPAEVVTGLSMVGGEAEDCTRDEEYARELQQEFDAMSNRSTVMTAPSLSPSHSHPRASPVSPVSKWKAAALRAVRKDPSQTAQSFNRSDDTMALGGLQSIANFCRMAAGRGKTRGGDNEEEEMLAGLGMETKVQQLAKMLRRQCVRHLPGGNKEKELRRDEVLTVAQVVSDCVRSVVVAPLERRHLQACREEKTEADLQLRGRAHMFLAKTQEDFGIPTHVQSSEDFISVVEALQAFGSDSSSSLQERLRLLLVVKEEVEKSYTRESRLRGKDPAKKPLAADDFMPVFSYVISRSNVQSLCGVILYIHEASGGAVMGEAMYYLCMLEAAVEYLSSVDLSSETQMKNMMEMNQLQRMLEERGILSGGKFAALKNANLGTTVKMRRHQSEIDLN